MTQPTDANLAACLECHREVTGDVCGHCGARRHLEGYELESIKVHHARGRLYVARAVADGRQVAVKELVFAHAPGIDALDAFERETRFLQTLDHPQIPRFIASFTSGEGVHTRMYLVQDYVAGESLLERVGHHQFTETELIAIAHDVLGVLVYLQGLTPQVFHRDVKPANLIARPDGSIALVDFGAARDLGATIGATVVGTFGYMPVEQLTGIVDATSDLFGLGATLLHLATRTEPWRADERTRRRAHLSRRFSAVLDKLTATDRANRFASAASAHDAIEALGRTDRSYLGPMAIAALVGAGLTYAGWRFSQRGDAPAVSLPAPPAHVAPPHAPAPPPKPPVAVVHPESVGPSDPPKPTVNCTFGILDANPRCHKGALVVSYPTYVGGAGRILDYVPGVGADPATAIDLPDSMLASYRFIAIAVDPRGPHYYVLNSLHAPQKGQEVGELQQRGFPPDRGSYEFRFLSSHDDFVDVRGIAFDTKRNRIIVSTVYDLYALPAAGGHWTKLASHQLNLSGLVYSPSDDILYSIQNGGRALLRFDADGRFLGKIDLATASYDARPANYFNQLALFGDQLTLIGESSKGNKSKLLGLTCEVVDLKSASVVRDDCWGKPQ